MEIAMIVRRPLEMEVSDRAEVKELDQEWTDLIVSALSLGLSVEEIRTFLRRYRFAGQGKAAGDGLDATGAE
jgi:DNA-binding transcriptional MerR regulator